MTEIREHEQAEVLHEIRRLAARRQALLSELDTVTDELRVLVLSAGDLGVRPGRLVEVSEIPRSTLIYWRSTAKQRAAGQE